MIQRIQSVWLLLTAICAFLSIKLFFYTGADATGAVALNGLSNWELTILTIAIGLIALYTLFSYKKRVLQFRLCITGIVLEALLIYLYCHTVSAFVSGTYSLTCLLQPAIVIFLVLAIRGIRKDDKLLKESDRLR
jgi:hypothetical protein